MEEFLQANKESLLRLVHSEGWRIFITGVVDEEVCVVIDRLNSLPLVGEESQALYAYYRGQLDLLKLVYNLEVAIRTLDMPEATEDLETGLANKFKNIYYRITGVIRR